MRMDVLTSETWWALNNKIKKASDIKLTSLYSTIKMMHGPINIKGLFQCSFQFSIASYITASCHIINTAQNAKQRLDVFKKKRDYTLRKNSVYGLEEWITCLEGWGDKRYNPTMTAIWMMHILSNKHQRCCFLQELFIITRHGFLYWDKKAEGKIMYEGEKKYLPIELLFRICYTTVICLREEELMDTWLYYCLC